MVEVWSERLQRAAWWLLLILLPVTSLPLASLAFGSSTVAPPSGVILAGILVAWFIPYLWRGGRLPRQFLPLLAFLVVVLVSQALAFFRSMPTYRGYSLTGSELKALATLLVGVSFFLVISCWAKTPARLAFVLKWVNWSGVAAIAWCLVQFYLWRRFEDYPKWLQLAQEMISTSRLYANRVTGFAYEPSWLAHQFNMLYLPFWLASVLHGTTVHRLRLGPLTMERVLFVAGLGILILSVSRIGLLAFVMMIALLLILSGVRLVGWLHEKVMRSSQMVGWRLRATRALVSVVLFTVLLALTGSLFLGSGYFLSRFDPRMQQFFNLQALESGSLLAYANQLVFAERVVFWQTGWDVFNQFPVFGVGVGNTGYYFMDKLSSFAWSLTEVRTLMFQQTALPNIKSLWVRILAETGIVGMACFLAWLYSMWRSADWLRRNGRGLTRTIGLAGLLVLVGMLPEGFSVDTFALPYYWISLGLAAAASSLALLPPEELRE